MARFIVLDSGPLWLACFAPGSNPAVDRCHAWMAALTASGARIIIPAIADYETRRVLLHRRARAKLRNLDALGARFGFLDTGKEALDHAAEFWALVRQQGQPTAADAKLDADCIVAGQARTIGGPADTVTVATSNVRHFNRFPGIDAREWTTIT